MGNAGDVVLLLAGVALVVATLGSAVRSTILPRGVPVRISRAINLSLRALFRLRAGRSPSYERRDKVMASFGPTALLALLSAWMLMLLVAFVLMFLAVATHSITTAIELSGSSLFTLGTSSARHLGPDLLSYAEAGLGLLLLTLLITYLPSIYTAFSRRENGVSLLRVRAGDPPRATTMLIRYHRIEDVNFRLSSLWQTWEGWFADVEESHTSFSILAFFRSPQPEQSWITAAGTLLDAASLWVAVVDHPNDPDAQLCIRAGFLALQRIATFFSIPFDATPAPGDPITISRAEFDQAMEEMAGAGMPLLADRDAGWEAYRGWRVNYDTALLNLARLVEAPPAPWVSDRSPLRDNQTWTLRRALTSRPGGTNGTTRRSRSRRP